MDNTDNVAYIVYGGTNKYMGSKNGKAIIFKDLHCNKVFIIDRKLGNTIKKTLVIENGEEKVVRDKSLYKTPLEAFLHIKNKLPNGDKTNIKWLLDYIEVNHAEYLI